MNDEILARLDDLKTGQDELKAGQQTLLTRIDELSARVDRHYVELLRAITESNEVVSGALESLPIRRAS